MVSEKEITDMARMMRIPIDDHREYQEKVRLMLGYFDVLDSAGVDDEEVDLPRVPLGMLREDIHEPHPESVSCVRRDSRGYVRAPGPG